MGYEAGITLLLTGEHFLTGGQDNFFDRRTGDIFDRRRGGQGEI